MGLFSRKKTNHKSVALFDIGSSVVGGAHALIPSQDAVSQNTIITSTIRQHLQYDETVPLKVHFKKVLDTFRDVAQYVQSHDIHNPDSVRVMLGAPWITSETKIIEYTKTSPFTCSQKFVNELVEKECERLTQEQQSFYIVEKQISSIKLNGYAVDKPYGKKTVSIEITLTITLASTVIVDYLRDAIVSIYGTRPVHFSSMAYSLFVVSENYLGSFEDLLLVIAGEELTQIGLVKKKIFYQYESFTPGTGLLTSIVAKKMAISYLEAFSLLGSFYLKKLADKENARILEAIAEYNQLWQAQFRGAIAKKQYGLCLPADCSVVANIRFNAIISDAIKTDPYLLHNCGSTSITPHFLTEETLIPYISFPQGVSFDTLIALHALFCKTFIYYTEK